MNINNKELIQECEKEFLWFVLKYGDLKLKEDNYTIVFNQNGFNYYDDMDIEYTLNEMSDKILLQVAQLLPCFVIPIMNKEEELKNG
jgi:Fe-S cluster assembly iron-binding protein IscA